MKGMFKKGIRQKYKNGFAEVKVIKLDAKTKLLVRVSISINKPEGVIK